MTARSEPVEGLSSSFSGEGQGFDGLGSTGGGDQAYSG